MTITRPMLASVATPEKLELIEWPAWCSPKVDGIRCLMHPELGPVTRSFKKLPNLYVYDCLENWAGGSYLDGELLAVDPEGNDLPYNETQSRMMSHGGQPNFLFAVFDCFETPDLDFETRHIRARQHVDKINRTEIRILQHTRIDSLEMFLEYANRCVENGYEGSIIRSPAGPYKSGRSTFNQGWLLKYKSWADAEGTVVGFLELVRNTNPDERHPEFDLAKRSSHQANMIPMGTLGALVLMTDWGELRVGTGFSAALRKEIWVANHVELNGHWTTGGINGCRDIGRKVTFKYQEFGMQDLPRFPVFKSFREDA